MRSDERCRHAIARRQTPRSQKLLIGDFSLIEPVGAERPGDANEQRRAYERQYGGPAGIRPYGSFLEHEERQHAACEDAGHPREQCKEQRQQRYLNSSGFVVDLNCRTL